MKELLDALVTVIQNGYEVYDDSGAKAFKTEQGFMFQYPDRGCVDCATADEAAKEFFNWGHRGRGDKRIF